MIDWQKVKSIIIDDLLKNENIEIDESQKNAIRKAASMLAEHGVILADEVGLGKTRIALVIMEAVLRAGGTVAAVVPPGLMYQWEGQINAVFENVPNAKIKEHIIHLRTFNSLFLNESFPLLVPNKPACIIASQGFGFLGRNTDTNDRYGLFSLTKYYSLQKKSAKWKEIQKKLERNSPVGLKNAAKFLAEKEDFETKVWKKFKDLPYEDISIKNKIFEDVEGMNLAYKCIGKLIGKIDFLVVDEAHKSRDKLSEVSNIPQTRLNILLEQILVQKSDFRRFCMTATPIELRSSQWNELFARCKIATSVGDTKFIDSFEKALADAQANPGNVDLLDTLIDASKVFTQKLSKYVIRRKRIKNSEYIERIKNLGLDIRKKNPHIDVQACSIDPEHFTEKQLNWKKAVYCFEGMSLASQGLNVSNNSSLNRSKLMRCRYAAGLVDIDDFSDEIKKLPDGPQKKRIEYWYQQSQWYASGKKNDGEKKDNTLLYSHPRIIKAARDIHEYVKKTGEKVLVFGTFSKPIEILRNTLNALYIIDCVLAKNIRPTSPMGLNVDDVWTVYRQSHETLDYDTFVNAVNKCFDENRNRSEKLNDSFGNEKICIELGLVIVKKENGVEKKIYTLTPEEMDGIGKRIRVDLAEALRDARIEQLDKEKAEQKKNKIFKKICEAYVKGSTDQFMTESKQNDGEADVAESRKRKILDALGLGNDKNMSRRVSAYCRLMDGNMKMSTRRIVQELFNDADAFPKVLIAQSTVGREGLNLQEACRCVYIFHPEWNPAVIEQEIGRVDRKRSLWENMADNYVPIPTKDIPKIIVRFVIFNGTYDEFQYKTYAIRKNMLDSQLSGILMEDKVDEIPIEYRQKLIDAAPDFEPTNESY